MRLPDFPSFRPLLLLLALSATTGLAAPRWLGDGQPGSHFGAALCSADFNGDGWPDLAVGAPLYETNGLRCGRVTLHLGGPAGPTTNAAWSFVGSQGDELTGWSLAAADFDRDGRDDLAVGAPVHGLDLPRQGQVSVFLGSPTGLSSKPTFQTTGATSYLELGWCLSAGGDFDGDGFPDLAAGAPFSSAGAPHAGSVLIWSGGAKSALGRRQWQVDGDQPWARFGWSIALFTPASNAATVLAVGQPFWAKPPDADLLGKLGLDLDPALLADKSAPPAGGCGRVLLWTGGPASLTNAPPGIRSGGPGEKFGWQVMNMGDVNGDGRPDIGIVSRSSLDGAGCMKAEIFTEPVAAGTASWRGLEPRVEATLGTMLAPVGDLNGDGCSDWVLAFPLLGHDGEREGQIQFFTGGRSAVPSAAQGGWEGDSPWQGLGATLAAGRHGNQVWLYVTAPDLSRAWGESRVGVWNGPATLTTTTLPATNNALLADQMRVIWDLRVAEKLKEATAMADKISAISSWRADRLRGEPFLTYALWRLGLLEPRMGHNEAGRHACLESGRLSDSLWHSTGAEERATITMEAAAQWNNLAEVAEREGRLGLARHAHRMAMTYYARALQERPIESRAWTIYDREYAMDVVVAEIDSRRDAGRYADYRAGLEEAIPKAHDSDFLYLERFLRGKLTRHLLFFEDAAAAAASAQARCDMPFWTRYGYDDHAVRTLLALCISRRDGQLGDGLQVAQASEEGIRAFPNPESMFWVQIWKAEMLMDAGRWDEALTTATACAEQAEAATCLSNAALARYQMARALAAQGKWLESGEECRSALLLLRRVGWLLEEPDCYNLYGQCLSHLGQHDLTVLTWNQGIELAVRLKLPFKEVRILLSMAEHYARLGDEVSLAATLERIRRLLAANPGLPGPTRRAAEELLRQMAARPAQPLDAHATTNGNTAVAGARDATPAGAVSGGAAAGRAMRWISPQSLETRVGPGEGARARWQLFNESSTPAPGRLTWTGARLVKQERRDDGLHLQLDLSRAEHAEVQADVPAADELAVHVDALPQVGVSAQVEWSWSAAATNRALWSVREDAAPRRIAVMEAAYDARNPFFGTPFFHEVVRRAGGPPLADLRAMASAPVRIEWVDLLHNTVLAVDAEGNGRFNDPGDVLPGDEDGDGFPELRIEEGGTRPLALVIYSRPGAELATAEVEIALDLRTGDTWQRQGVDVLRVQ